MPRPTKPPAKKAAAKRTRKPPAKTTTATARTPAVTQRDRDVVNRRQAGETFETIAATMRFRDFTAAHTAYERGLTKTLPVTPTEQRRSDLEQITKAEDKLWPKAERGNLAAIDQLVDLALERARLSTDPLPDERKRRIGPVEAATVTEADRLKHVAPALAATAKILARVVDDNASGEPGYTATAARELRMHMSQLRGLAGTQPDAPPAAEPAKKTAGSKKQTVVPETRLEQLRREARERSSS